MDAQLIKLALEQAPALAIVAILLYIFLKAFERVIDKLTEAQDNIIQVIKENHAVITRWESKVNTSEQQLAETTKELATITKNLVSMAQQITFSCPPRENQNGQR